MQKQNFKFNNGVGFRLGWNKQDTLQYAIGNRQWASQLANLKRQNLEQAIDNSRIKFFNVGKIHSWPIVFLPIANCLLPIAHCLLSVATCQLPIASCPLRIVCGLLPIAN